MKLTSALTQASFEPCLLSWKGIILEALELEVLMKHSLNLQKNWSEKTVISLLFNVPFAFIAYQVLECWS